ncbi:hypothetical protein D3C73_1129370 [compost metagenome]
MQPAQFDAACMRAMQAQVQLVKQLTLGVEGAEQQMIVVVLQLRTLHTAEEAGFGIDVGGQVAGAFNLPIVATPGHEV